MFQTDLNKFLKYSIELRSLYDSHINMQFNVQQNNAYFTFQLRNWYFNVIVKFHNRTNWNTLFYPKLKKSLSNKLNKLIFTFLFNNIIYDIEDADAEFIKNIYEYIQKNPEITLKYFYSHFYNCSIKYIKSHFYILDYKFINFTKVLEKKVPLNNYNELFITEIFSIILNENTFNSDIINILHLNHPTKSIMKHILKNYFIDNT